MTQNDNLITSSEESRLTPRSIIFWRYVIGLILALMVLPPYQVSSLAEYAGGVAVKITAAFAPTIIITVLGLLFFTAVIKPRIWWWFAVLSWGFGMVGSGLMWYGEISHEARHSHLAVPIGSNADVSATYAQVSTVLPDISNLAKELASNSTSKQQAILFARSVQSRSNEKIKYTWDGTQVIIDPQHKLLLHHSVMLVLEESSGKIHWRCKTYSDIFKERCSDISVRP